MADVVVHRCTLRLIRRGGWSWGIERDGLVEAARQALPRLLARELERLHEDGEDDEREITAPVGVRLSLTAAELRALAFRAADRQDAAGTAEAEAVAAIEAAVARAIAPLRARLRAPRRLTDSPPAADAAPTATAPPADAAAVLRAWHAHGVLAARLALFSTAALRRWWRAVAGATAPPSNEPALDAPADSPTAAPDQPSRDLAASAPAHARDDTEPLDDGVDARALSAALIAFAARAPTEPPAPRLQVPIDARLRPRAETLPTEVAALPFLLLGPLTQIGFLDALAASFAACDRSADVPAFACGLALKALPPPERGWLRRPLAAASASAFGAVTAIPDALGALAHEASEELLSPLRALLTRAVVEAHTAERPWLVTAVDGGLLVADADGLFPAAHTAHATLPALLAGAAGLLYVARDAATPALLAALDAAGRTFVTDAPPVRGERLRRLRGAREGRFFTNDRITPDAFLYAQAPKLAAACAELPPLWRALTVERPCAPGSPRAALDRLLAQAAMLALAWIAWSLWRAREPAHPGLALDRFADLEARLDWRDDALAVKLPLGRRRADLDAHRLLGDVAGVPWLAPRVVRFTGG